MLIGVGIIPAAACELLPQGPRDCPCDCSLEGRKRDATIPVTTMTANRAMLTPALRNASTNTTLARPTSH